MVRSERLTIRTRRQGDTHDLTRPLAAALGRSGLEAPSVAASTFFGLTVILAPLLFAIFYGMAGWTKDGQALHDMLGGQSLGQAGARVVVEEFLDGEEASFIAICDGEHALAMATSLRD